MLAPLRVEAGAWSTPGTSLSVFSLDLTRPICVEPHPVPSFPDCTADWKVNGDAATPIKSADEAASAAVSGVI